MNNFFGSEDTYHEHSHEEVLEFIMNMKKKNKRFIILGIAAGLLIGIAGTALFYGKFLVGSNFYMHAKLTAVTNVLDKYYLRDYNSEKLADMTASAAALSVEDPYTVYYTKEQFSDLLDSSNGDFVGIGATVSVTEDNEIVILAPIEGSPAEKAGLQAGDILMKIEGEAYTGDQLSEAIEAIRGINSGKEAGVSVSVTVRRGDDVFDVTLTRERIHTDSVSYKMLDDYIGYIKIDAFNTKSKNEKDTYEEFIQAIDELKNQGADKLIFDVRNNGGGDAEIVSKMLDYLLPEGLIMYTEDKHGNRNEVMSDASELNMKMAVITNENSASASELFTGALKDYKKAVVVGKRTFGKGVVQTVIPFLDGSGIKVTTSNYFTPGGTCVQDVGITPDIEVELPEEYKNMVVTKLEFEQDTQLQKAVEVLITK